MSRAPFAVAAFSSLVGTLPACTDAPASPSIEGETHVATYWVGERRPPPIDVLLVIDDTTAMAPWQDRVAELPTVVESALGSLEGGFPDLRIAVTTNGGELRTAPGLAEPYVVVSYNPDGTRDTNFSGALHEALAPLVDVGAGNTGPSQLLHAAERALTSEALLRDNAYTFVATISASDDASLASPAYYASAFKATRPDPANVVVSGIYPPGATRLDEFHTQFPNRNTRTALDAPDWSGAFALVAQLNRTTLSLPCFEQPLDIDPEAPGEQFDCAMSYWIDDVEWKALPQCGSSLPCWELVDATQSGCIQPYSRALRIRGDVYHPELRGQCVVK